MNFRVEALWDVWVSGRFQRMTEEAREAREARDLAVRKFRLELEDNGGFDAGEIAMLTMSFDRAYGEGVAEGIRQAREAALEYSRLAQEQSNQAKDSGAHRLADMAFGRSVGAEHVAERLDALGTRD